MDNLAKRSITMEKTSEADIPVVDVPAVEMPPAQLILKYLRDAGDSLDIKDDGDKVFDALAVAMAAERLDPILMRVRARANVMRLLASLSRSTYLITHLAEMFKIEYDGSPVEADENFGIWDQQRLTRLTALITTHVSAARTTVEESQALLKGAVAKSEADAATIKKLTDDINRERIEADARVKLHADNCVRYTSLLATYNDIPMFVVARVDPTTGNVETYLKVEEDAGLRGVKNFGAATRFKDFAEANDLRIEAIRLRRAKVARLLRASVSSQYAVMQVAVRSVDLQTVIDESPDVEEDDDE